MTQVMDARIRMVPSRLPSEARTHAAEDVHGPDWQCAAGRRGEELGACTEVGAPIAHLSVFRQGLHDTGASSSSTAGIW